MAFLKHELRYHPKNYFRSDAYQLWKITGGERGWDGYHYPLNLKTPGAGEILRGRKDEIVELCQTQGFKMDLERVQESPFANVTADDITDDLIKSQFNLDPNQKNAIVQWLLHGMGVANMAVNAGKTQTFAAAAAFVKLKYPDARFLYFTFTERLVTQVMGEMTKMLPDWHITQYGGGGKRDYSGKDMVVATQAILSRNFVDLVREKFFESFQALLLDESHHCQSPTAEKVLRACTAYFRFGASDTIKEDDKEKWNKIKGLCGPVRCVVTSSSLIEVGRSAAPHVYLVDIEQWKGKFRHMDHEPQKRSTAWTFVDNQWIRATYLGPVYKLDDKGKRIFKRTKKLREDRWVTEMIPLTIPTVHNLKMEDGTEQVTPARFTILHRRYDKAIILFKERNELIREWVKYYHKKKWNTIVVATRTPHVIVLETLLNQTIPGFVRSLVGEAGTSERNNAFSWFKHTPGAVLVTPLIKEGVSINEIKAGVIADPVADWELAKQIIGRFMRKKAENACHVTWFIDRQHPNYFRNAVDLMDRLAKIEGFTFYHPVSTPDTIGQALIHKGQL